MKKLVGVFVLVMSVLFLVACGNKQSNIDGTYYKFYQSEGYPMKISKLYPMKISGNSLVTSGPSKTYEINFNNNTIIGEDEVLDFTIEKNSVIIFNDDMYVKDGSERLKELVDSGAEIIE